MDKTDEKVINELLANAKKPLRDIAKKLRVSFVTVMNRIKKLEKEKIIKGYTAKVDYEKLGYQINVIIEIQISQGKLFELERKIASYSFVHAVYDVTGDYDAIVFARFKTTRAMDNFLKKIQTLDFVKKTNTKLVLNTIKENQEKV